MAIALVFNPGSNSLKFELIELLDGQVVASLATKLVSGSLDDIGKKEPKLSLRKGSEPAASKSVDAGDMAAAVRAGLDSLREQEDLAERLERLDFVAVRVVHGG